MVLHTIQYLLMKLYCSNHNNVLKRKDGAGFNHCLLWYCMKYFFSNIIIEVDGISLTPSSCFNEFRNQIFKKADIHIDVQIINSLSLKSPTVYEDENYIICSDDGLETRIYKDGWKKPYALLREYSYKEKKLYVLRERIARVSQEIQMFNHLALERSMILKNIFLIHASFIKTLSGGILFTAPSQTGKSTQAALWEKYMGCEIINGDRAAIWKSDKGWITSGIPWCGSSSITKNQMVPLKAIVMLKQSPENKVSNIPVAQKIKFLMHEITINPWNKEMIMCVQELLLDLCCDVAIVELACRPDEDAVKLLAKVLEVNHV